MTTRNEAMAQASDAAAAFLAVVRRLRKEGFQVTFNFEGLGTDALHVGMIRVVPLEDAEDEVKSFWEKYKLESDNG